MFETIAITVLCVLLFVLALIAVCCIFFVPDAEYLALTVETIADRYKTSGQRWTK